VADDPNCLVLRQVAAGVAVRMAVLYLLGMHGGCNAED
jgi:aspartate carbamoyltransferase catalytic subunit